jgi:hypothetical protein
LLGKRGVHLKHHQNLKDEISIRYNRRIQSYLK